MILSFPYNTRRHRLALGTSWHVWWCRFGALDSPERQTAMNKCLDCKATWKIWMVDDGCCYWMVVVVVVIMNDFGWLLLCAICFWLTGFPHRPLLQPETVRGKMMFPNCHSYCIVSWNVVEKVPYPISTIKIWVNYDLIGGVPSEDYSGLRNPRYAPRHGWISLYHYDLLCVSTCLINVYM